MPVNIDGLLPSRSRVLSGKRRQGRPSIAGRKKFAYEANKRFALVYGQELLDLFKKKGYLTVKRNAKGKVVKPESKIVERVDAHGDTVKVEIVDPTVTHMGDSSVSVLFRIVNALVDGKEVEGFTLIPAGKTQNNHTIESVLIPEFPLGNPAYGYSLCKLK